MNWKTFQFDDNSIWTNISTFTSRYFSYAPWNIPNYVWSMHCGTIDLQLKDESFALEHQLRAELLSQSFEKSCRDILGNRNVPSSTMSSFSLSKNDHNSFSRIRENRLLRKQLDQEFQLAKLAFEWHSLVTIADKYLLVDILHQASHLYMDVLLQSLSIWSRLNETLDDVQKRLHKQLHDIVLLITQHIVENNFVLHSTMNSASHQSLTAKNSDCSRDLLETCYEEFQWVLKNIEYRWTFSN